MLYKMPQLGFIRHFSLLFISVLYVNVDIILSKKFPEYEKIKLEIKDDISNFSGLTVRHSGGDFLIFLDKINYSVIAPGAEIVSYYKNFTRHEWLNNSTNFDNLVYEGKSRDGKKSFASGYKTNEDFTGFVLHNNGTSSYLQPLVDDDSPAHAKYYKAGNVKFDFCYQNGTCEEHGVFKKSIILCKLNEDKMVCSDEIKRNETSSHIPRLKETRNTYEFKRLHTFKNKFCGITMVSDPTHFKSHKELKSLIQELITIALYVDHIFKWADFDIGGSQSMDNLGILIDRIHVIASVENPDLQATLSRGNLIKTGMDDYLEVYRDLPQSSCMAIVFVSDPIAANVVSAADSGGVCRGSTGTNNRTHNIGVVNTMNIGGQKKDLFEIAWLTVMLAGQIVGSQGQECKSIQKASSTEKWLAFFSICQRESINAILKSQGSCLKKREISYEGLTPSKTGEIDDVNAIKPNEGIPSEITSTDTSDVDKKEEAPAFAPEIKREEMSLKDTKESVTEYSSKEIKQPHEPKPILKYIMPSTDDWDGLRKLKNGQENGLEEEGFAVGPEVTSPKTDSSVVEQPLTKKTKSDHINLIPNIKDRFPINILPANTIPEKKSVENSSEITHAVVVTKKEASESQPLSTEIESISQDPQIDEISTSISYREKESQSDPSIEAETRSDDRTEKEPLSDPSMEMESQSEPSVEKKTLSKDHTEEEPPSDPSMEMKSQLGPSIETETLSEDHSEVESISQDPQTVEISPSISYREKESHTDPSMEAETLTEDNTEEETLSEDHPEEKLPPDTSMEIESQSEPSVETKTLSEDHTEEEPPSDPSMEMKSQLEPSIETETLSEDHSEVESISQDPQTVEISPSISYREKESHTDPSMEAETLTEDNTEEETLSEDHTEEKSPSDPSMEIESPSDTQSDLTLKLPQPQQGESTEYDEALIHNTRDSDPRSQEPQTSEALESTMVTGEVMLSKEPKEPPKQSKEPPKVPNLGLPVIPSDKIPLCGNSLVDPGEECDCGNLNTCKRLGSCCVPPPLKNQCHYNKSRNAECEITDPCCSNDCKILPGKTPCNVGNVCAMEASSCNGISSKCPSKGNPMRTNGRRCRVGEGDTLGHGTCWDGHCRGTVCTDSGREDCRCPGKHGSCEVCCFDHHRNGSEEMCVLAWELGLQASDGTPHYKADGSPCQGGGICGYGGYCMMETELNVKSDQPSLSGLPGITAVISLWAVLWRIACVGNLFQTL